MLDKYSIQFSDCLFGMVGSYDAEVDIVARNAFLEKYLLADSSLNET